MKETIYGHSESGEPAGIRVHESPREIAQAESRQAEQKLIDSRARLTHAGASEEELARFENAAEEFREGVEKANEFLAENSKDKPEFAASVSRGELQGKSPAETYPAHIERQIDFLLTAAEMLEAAGYPAAAEDVDTRLEKIRGLLRQGKQETAGRKILKLTEELKRNYQGLSYFEGRDEVQPPPDLAVADTAPENLEAERAGPKIRNVLHGDLRHIDPEARTKHALHTLK